MDERYLKHWVDGGTGDGGETDGIDRPVFCKRSGSPEPLDSPVHLHYPGDVYSPATCIMRSDGAIVPLVWE